MRFISASYRLATVGTSGGGTFPPPSFRWRRPVLLGQGAVLGELGVQFLHGGIGIDAGLLDAVGPGLDQRLGRLLPHRGLRRGELIDFVTGFGLYLVDAGVLEFAPPLADAAGRFGV